VNRGERAPLTPFFPLLTGLHLPRVSPWRRCAFSALLAILIVLRGCFFRPVWWQIVIFFACGFGFGLGFGVVVVVPSVVVDGVVVVVG
jgi:hypothetical protein